MAVYKTASIFVSLVVAALLLTATTTEGRALSQGLPSPTPEPEAKAVQPAMAVTSVKATIPVPSNETAASAPQGPTSSPQAPLPEPTFWWATPAEIAKTEWKNETKIFDNETYFNVMEQTLPYTIVFKYVSTAGPLWLGSTKGGKEYGIMAPKGPADSQSAYTFPPNRTMTVYVSDFYVAEGADGPAWSASNAFLPIKLAGAR